MLKLIDEYLITATAEKGLSKNSCDSYRNDLEFFAEFLNNKSMHLEQIDINFLREFIQVLYKMHYSETSIARKLASIRQFFKYLYLEKIISKNVALDLEMPKKQKKLPNILTLSDIDKLFMHIENPTDKDIRMLAMLELLYASGLRVSELVSLEFTKLTKDKKIADSMLVKGKGNKERLVFLNESAKQALEAYINIRKNFGDNKYLFCSKASQGHITRQRFGQLLKEHAARCGITPSKISPHTIRHSFATHMLENGADLRSIQELLGHVSINTTQIYTHVLDSKLKGVMNDCHPLSQKNSV